MGRLVLVFSRLLYTHVRCTPFCLAPSIRFYLLIKKLKMYMYKLLNNFHYITFSFSLCKNNQSFLLVLLCLILSVIHTECQSNETPNMYVLFCLPHLNQVKPNFFIIIKPKENCLVNDGRNFILLTVYLLHFTFINPPKKTIKKPKAISFLTNFVLKFANNILVMQFSKVT